MAASGVNRKESKIIKPCTSLMYLRGEREIKDYK